MPGLLSRLFKKEGDASRPPTGTTQPATVVPPPAGPTPRRASSSSDEPSHGDFNSSDSDDLGDHSAGRRLGGARRVGEKPAPCRFHQRGHCKFQSNCNFSHDGPPGTGGPTLAPHRRAPPPKPKPARAQEFCQFFMAGHCRDGANCSNKHYADGVDPGDFAVPGAEGGRRLGRGSGSDSSGDDGGGVAMPPGGFDVDNMTYEQLLALEDQMGKADVVKRVASNAGKALPVIDWRPTGNGDASDPEHQSCSICMTDYQVGDKINLLPCFHRFHPDCATQWFDTGKTECPICKADIRRTGSRSYSWD